MRKILLFVFLVASVIPLRASPGAVTLSWNYDAATKMVTIHVMNATNKDITAYAINVTIKHPDANADISEMIEDSLPLMASKASQGQVAQNDNGTFAAGTSEDKPIPQTKDVTVLRRNLEKTSILAGFSIL